MAAPRLLHNVFFRLKERTPQRVAQLVDACRKYLPEHAGIEFFAVGPRAEKYQRPVNDQQYDIALSIAFATVEHHDSYQQSEPHKQFIAEQSANWEQVRVFDSLD